LPFVREGLALQEPVLAAPTSTNSALLQRELGEESARVDWAENAEQHKPVERLAVFQRYIAEQVDRGATRLRLLGEPVWPADSAAGVAEWKRYESFLNVALARHPVWLVCPYDAGHLSEGIVADACRTHPTMGYGHERRASPDYVEPADFARLLDRAEKLPAPPPGAIERCFDAAADVRRFVVDQARAAGLRAEKIEGAKLAASEVATNAFRHASSLARVRTWLLRHAFVCEVSDAGSGIENPFVGYVTPDPARGGGWGLSIARHVCDVVEVRAGPAGTTVRLHLNLS
jgi:anti-sigma regulatory factor (Ser/Thr protein kinase)